jgi:glycerol uptake facilitator-like aquaporin
MLVMAMYWEKVWDVSAVFIEAGRPLVGGGAPASILCPMPHEWQSLAYLFLNEFFADFFIGIAIWAALDPTNPFVKPAAIPFIIGFAYAAMIWGFGSLTLSTNLARDLGPRIVAAIFFGSEAFTHKSYAPIGMLVNIPATLLATAYYELWMRDSLLTLRRGHASLNDDEAV